MASSASKRKADSKAEEVKPTAANGVVHTGRKRKLRPGVPREGPNTFRWLLTFLVLAIAMVVLAYYVTYNGRVATREQHESGAANSNVTDSAAKKATNKAKETDKVNTKKTTKSPAKKEKASDKKPGKEDKKSNKKSTKKPTNKEPEAEGEHIIPRRKDKYINKTTVDLTNIPVLQWPIEPADPDRPFIIEILTGEKAIRRKKFKQALEAFEEILTRFPQSPRGMYGKAQTLCKYAELKRSNKYLDLCIDAFYSVGIDNIITPKDLRREALLRLADRASFRGKLQTNVKAWVELVRHFPDNQLYARKVALAYLTAGKNAKALEHFKAAVTKWPDDLFSKAHVGLLLKLEGKYERALPLLLDGLKKDEEIRKLAQFFHHGGECLTRLGRSEEALVLHSEGVSLGHFLSPWQRSVNNEPGLHGQPWWLLGDTSYQNAIELLEGRWETIKLEALGVINRLQHVAKGICETGELRRLLLYSNGKANDNGCSMLPETCALISSIPASATCKRCQAELIAMVPGTVTWPAVAPSNTQLRLHLGIEVPSNSGIRVADKTRNWQEGKVLIFDDSFEHSMWNKGDDSLLVLLSVDVWHPDLSVEKRKSLTPI